MYSVKDFVKELIEASIGFVKAILTAVAIVAVLSFIVFGPMAIIIFGFLR